MPRLRPAAVGLLVLLSFTVVGIAQTWPLLLHLTDALTGSPGGDTGVYVWNTWVFRHELLNHHWPFSTTSVLALGGGADLSLHNYTVFSNLISAPLQGAIGVIAAFNVAYLLNFGLAGLGMFVLVRHTWRDAGVSVGVAWLAALVFAASPFLMARSTAHFSLAAAAPLPFFVVFFERTWERRRISDALCAGACAAWAGYCDAYYTVYCALLAVTLSIGHLTQILPRSAAPPGRRWLLLLDVPIVAGVVAVFLMGAQGGTAWSIGGLTISMRSLYTPVLVLTVLVVARLWFTRHHRLVFTAVPVRALMGPAAAMAAIAALGLAPVLFAVLARSADGDFVPPPVLWRSSAPGVDLASLFVPNPNHPLAPRWLVDWTARQPGHYEENVAALPWTALVVIAAAWRFAAYRPLAIWGLSSLFFAALSLGPFIRVAGIDTFIPTPWALLRYVPVLDQARMPARFSVLVIMAVALIFAGALAALVRTRRNPGLFVAGVAAVLGFELLAAPRPLYSAAPPAIYDIIARDARPDRVLEVPFGVRDGLSSLGDFSAASLVFQAHHGKDLVGGYLSRVSASQKALYLQHPVTSVLLATGENRDVTPAQRDAARAAADAFIEDVSLGWVVIDERRAGTEAAHVAREVLNLVPIARDGVFALYAPASRRLTAAAGGGESARTGH